MKDLFQSFRSRKLVVVIISVVGIVINDLLGKPLAEETIYSSLAMLGTYIVGQGIADAGTSGAATAVKRAISQGVDIAESVKDVLGSSKKALRYIHDDDGPYWEETSEIDDDDKPKG